MAKHPQLSSFGQGFTPKLKIFTLKKNQTVTFEYNGPLPDLIIASVTQPRPDLVVVQVKNQGNMDAGPFQVEISYSYWEGPKKLGYPTYRQKSINGLAKRQTESVQWGVITEEGKQLKLNSVKVDYKSEVWESNEKNNTKEWEW